VRLQVGVTYEKTLDWPAGTIVTFVCVAECVEKTARFKKEEPGYKILILNVDGPNYWSLATGQIHSYVRGVNFFTKLRRVGSDPTKRVR
jgi:hypothetical protein